MQKYPKNRLLCGSNLTILLYGRRQLLHLLQQVTLYVIFWVKKGLYIRLFSKTYRIKRKRQFLVFVAPDAASNNTILNSASQMAFILNKSQ